MKQSLRKAHGSIWKGIGLVFLCHLVWVLYSSSILYVTLLQFFYVLPLIIFFRKKQETKTIQGLWIGAGMTFLLHAGIYGYCMLTVTIR